jgi:hypothetical protein
VGNGAVVKFRLDELDGLDGIGVSLGEFGGGGRGGGRTFTVYGALFSGAQSISLVSLSSNHSNTVQVEGRNPPQLQRCGSATWPRAKFQLVAPAYCVLLT